MGESDEALQGKHRSLRRLVIAQGDLCQAHRFAELIITHKDLEIDNEEERHKYKDLITALNPPYSCYPQGGLPSGPRGGCARRQVA